eukprot:SAG25_NODE_21_length_22373_cov_13.904373_6_plen_124_part_00
MTPPEKLFLCCKTARLHACLLAGENIFQQGGYPARSESITDFYLAKSLHEKRKPPAPTHQLGSLLAAFSTPAGHDNDGVAADELGFWGCDGFLLSHCGHYSTIIIYMSVLGNKPTFSVPQPPF